MPARIHCWHGSWCVCYPASAGIPSPAPEDSSPLSCTWDGGHWLPQEAKQERQSSLCLCSALGRLCPPDTHPDTHSALLHALLLLILNNPWGHPKLVLCLMGESTLQLLQGGGEGILHHVPQLMVPSRGSTFPSGEVHWALAAFQLQELPLCCPTGPCGPLQLHHGP